MLYNRILILNVVLVLNMKLCHKKKKNILPFLAQGAMFLDYIDTECSTIRQTRCILCCFRHGQLYLLIRNRTQLKTCTVAFVVVFFLLCDNSPC